MANFSVAAQNTIVVGVIGHTVVNQTSEPTNETVQTDSTTTTTNTTNTITTTTAAHSTILIIVPVCILLLVLALVIGCLWYHCGWCKKHTAKGKHRNRKANKSDSSSNSSSKRLAVAKETQAKLKCTAAVSISTTTAVGHPIADQQTSRSALTFAGGRRPNVVIEDGVEKSSSLRLKPLFSSLDNNDRETTVTRLELPVSKTRSGRGSVCGTNDGSSNNNDQQQQQQQKQPSGSVSSVKAKHRTAIRSLAPLKSKSTFGGGGGGGGQQTYRLGDRVALVRSGIRERTTVNSLATEHRPTASYSVISVDSAARPQRRNSTVSSAVSSVSSVASRKR